MGQIKVVLIFNEDDERQREAGEYLKTKKRCKTALELCICRRGFGRLYVLIL